MNFMPQKFGNIRKKSKFTPDFEINGIKYLNYQRKPGFYVGGFLKLEFSEKFTVSTGISFCCSGNRSANGKYRGCG